MKIKHKLKQSANNSLTRIIRDSSPGAIVGTLVGFILVCVASIIVGGGNVFAVSYEYSIKYNDNVVDNMPMDVNDGKAVGGNLTIANETPTRSGYKFLGWCNTLPTTTDGTDSCSGTTYQPKAGITIASAANFHFYALWSEAKTIANATYMQEVGACPNTLETEKIYTLKDSRDGQEYSVAKLKDGKCWMIENLNLAGGTTLTPDETDFDPSYTIPTTQGWQADGRLPDSRTSGFDTSNYAYVYNSGNKVNCGSNRRVAPCYSYYSWDVATLGSGRSITVENTDAPYSICPKNWRLPTSRTTVAGNSDFYQLAVAYGMNNNAVSQSASTTSNFYNQAGPGTTPNLLLTGYYEGGALDDAGSGGYYWSATTSNGNYSAHYLYLYSSLVSTSGTYKRYYGFSIRCVFSE